jgi:hypothetical protein
VEKEDWPAQYPTAARCFSPALARATLGQLLTASRADQVYQLTDYHWLLLYDTLRAYCALHNDYAQEAPTQTLPVGPYQIGPIDFDALLDLYFWDTDFLLEGPTLAGLGPDTRKAMDVADEVFGISQGLPPHPDELKLTTWAESGWEKAGEEGEAHDAGPHAGSSQLLQHTLRPTPWAQICRGVAPRVHPPKGGPRPARMHIA